MGRWDESIYGGDDSLKLKEKIYEICESEEYGDDNKVQPIPLDVLSEKIDDIKNMIDNSENGNDYKNIGYQVFAAILMHSGFDIECDDDLKKKIIKSIDKDEWSNERPLRRIVLNNFKKIINEYDCKSINIEAINLFEEGEEEDCEEIAKEFKEVFGLINSRIKKLESNIDEKSGVKEYDEGYSDAADEEIDFLTDFKELLSKQELMGVLLEKISKEIESGGSPELKFEGEVATLSPVMSNKGVDAGRADVQPG